LKNRKKKNTSIKKACNLLAEVSHHIHYAFKIVLWNTGTMRNAVYGEYDALHIRNVVVLGWQGQD
jgi:hypothetical protein